MNPDFSYVAQEKGSPTCSAAAKRMALRRFGYDQSDEAIMAELPGMDELDREGFNNDGYGEHLGRYFECDVRDGGEVEEIRRALSEGKVVIVNFVLGEYPQVENGWYRPINGKKTDGHYGVVVKLEGDVLEIHDPEFGPNQRMPLSDFLRRWHAFYSKHVRWRAILAGVRDDVKPLLQAI